MNHIREIKDKKQRPFWQVIVMILESVIVLNNFITLCNKLEEYTGIDANISSIVLLIFSGVICFLIILRLLSNYVYSFVGDSIIFERIVGKKTKFLLKVELSEILFIKSYDKVENDNVFYTYKFYYNNDKEHLYYGEFIRDEKRYRVVFKPSERMLRILSSKVNEVF